MADIFEQRYNEDCVVCGGNPCLSDCPEFLLDNDIDDMYDYLEKIWDAILMVLPVIEEDPSKKRRSGSDRSDGYDDNLLFRPIGQTNIFAVVAAAAVVDYTKT